VNRHRRAVAAFAVACAFVLTGCSAGSTASSPAGSGFVSGDGSITLLDPAERPAAPNLVGTTLDGATYSLTDDLGKVVVLNVWASWCAPCRAEAPVLVALSEELEPKGVQFIGLDTRDSDVAARTFVAKQGITYPNVIDRDGRLQLLFGDSLPPQAIPSTIVIDRQGRVAGRILGKASASDLRGMIEPLLSGA
jgi:thiol-disulfide isomerase/thioredoxin